MRTVGDERYLNLVTKWRHPNNQLGWRRCFDSTWPSMQQPACHQHTSRSTASSTPTLKITTPTNTKTTTKTAATPTIAKEHDR